MKRLICVVLAALCLCVPALKAEDKPAYYAKEGVLTLPAGDMLSFQVQNNNLQGQLSLALPPSATGTHLPLTSTVMTLDKAFLPGVQLEKEVFQRMDSLFSFYTKEDVAFEREEQGVRLSYPLPVMVGEEGLLSNAVLQGVAGDTPLYALNSEEEYKKPIDQPFIGNITIHTSCNIRKGPSANTERVARTGARAVFPCLAQEDIWYRIRLLDGSEGYVSANMATLAPLPGLKDAALQLIKGDLTGAERSLLALGYPVAAAQAALLTQYMEAGNLLKKGKYQEAAAAYRELSAFGGAAQKAEMLKDVQPLPASGVLQAPAFAQADCEMRVTAAKRGPYLVKIYAAQQESPVAILLLLQGETVSVALPKGSYTLRYATGDVWHGLDKSFGARGLYAKASEPIVLEAPGQRATITLSPEEGNVDYERLEADAF